MDLIGKMRSKISFYTNSPTAQGAGAKDGYTHLLDTFGYLRRNSGNRGLVAAEIITEGSYLLTVRYQITLAVAMSLHLKIMISNERYTIHSYSKKEEGRNDFYDFVLFKKEV